MVIMAEKGNERGNALVLDILKMKREDGKKMSQYLLARRLSVSDNAVYKWVKGQASPNESNFKNLREFHLYLDRIQRIFKPFQRVS